MADKSERSNKSRELSIKVDVDVSEALTGLKALQREAKKATQALREVEAAQKNSVSTSCGTVPLQDNSYVVTSHGVGADKTTVYIPTINEIQGNFPIPPINHLRECSDVDLTDVPTALLHRELVRREGVEEYAIDSHGGYAKIAIDNVITGKNFFVEGPARIVVNRD